MLQTTESCSCSLDTKGLKAKAKQLQGLWEAISLSLLQLPEVLACLGFELHGFSLPVFGLQEAPLLFFCGFVMDVRAYLGLGEFHLEFHYYMVCVNIFEK